MKRKEVLKLCLVSCTSHQGGYSHDAVVHALRKCGIRHIDTAKRYGCEALLQKAIKESGVKREDLWITTKLWHSDYGYENTKKACLESCERLGVEYLDLYLIHWPDAHVLGKSNREVRAETWRAMEDLYEKGDIIMKTYRGRTNYSAFGDLGDS
ncbi:PREDICTED: uncharacterized oxidoreductase ZK1290.5-like, partial [Chlamydotis macqueenii]|uniref:uncharacterized oxidoreductase ZK1290.5-like n=1 Tax=Chlamydotis macqueenii TaxID=187382 RepID=UPI000529B3FC